MGEVRKGRQTPTQSVTLPYSSTHGAEAIEIYNSTGRTAQEWQELLDLAAMHGINPRTGTASSVIGENHFDAKVTQTVDYTSSTPDENLEDAIALVDGSEGDVTGFALSKTFGSAMAKVKANGIKQYPEFSFGASPATFSGIPTSVNKTISGGSTKDHGIVGNFQGGFKWGYSKEIPMEIIQYGDPDNSGKDLKGHGQIYIRTELYLGWGILVPEWFARIKEAA